MVGGSVNLCTPLNDIRFIKIRRCAIQMWLTGTCRSACGNWAACGYVHLYQADLGDRRSIVSANSQRCGGVGGDGGDDDGVDKVNSVFGLTGLHSIGD